MRESFECTYLLQFIISIQKCSFKKKNPDIEAMYYSYGMLQNNEDASYVFGKYNEKKNCIRGNLCSKYSEDIYMKKN